MSNRFSPTTMQFSLSPRPNRQKQTLFHAGRRNANFKKSDSYNIFAEARLAEKATYLKSRRRLKGGFYRTDDAMQWGGSPIFFAQVHLSGTRSGFASRGLFSF
jgi:hypothetical protein